MMPMECLHYGTCWAPAILEEERMLQQWWQRLWACGIVVCLPSAKAFFVQEKAGGHLVYHFIWKLRAPPPHVFGKTVATHLR
jgi:hypothetical protein